MANPYQQGQLRRARKELGLTQAEEAERLAALAWYRNGDRVGVNADMVAKWERGFKFPSRLYRPLLCLLFNATPASLGLVAPGAQATLVPRPAAPTEVPWAEVLLALGAPGRILHNHLIEDWERDLLRRRDLLKSMGLGALASMLGPLPSPVARAARGRDDLRPTAETFDDVQELAASYQRLYHETAPQTLMTPIKAHLQAVSELLRRGCARHERRMLLANQGQVALLAGRMAFFDLRDPLSARGYLEMAYESALDAGDTPLVATALGHLGFVPAASAQWSAAADHLNRAVTYADHGAPRAVRSWLAAVASEIQTDAGNHKAARVAIDDAKRLGEASSDAPLPPWFDFYDSSRLHGFEGYALLRGGSAGAATPVLKQAIDELPGTAIKQRTVFLTDLATGYLQQGELDHACDLAVRAVTDLRTRQYATCVGRLRDFRATLRPYATSRAVRELDHAMVEL